MAWGKNKRKKKHVSINLDDKKKGWINGFSHPRTKKKQQTGQQTDRQAHCPKKHNQPTDKTTSETMGAMIMIK